jgi:hypothetical protein
MITVTTRLKADRTGVSMIMNERYTDFLKFALQRIVENAIFYESEAKICKDPANKLFLYYLAGKKRVQHVVLEMIASSTRKGKLLNLPEYNNSGLHDTAAEGISLADATSEEILKFAHSHAEKDLNLYVSLAALEEDSQTKKLLSTLARLTRDFIQDITAGYSKFTFQRSEKRTTHPTSQLSKKVYERVATE